MTLCLNRHDGSPATMDVGEWCNDSPFRCRTIARHVLLRCPDCGATYNIEATDVADCGSVTTEFVCQTPSCGLVRDLRLDGWSPLGFDLTDVKL